MITTTVEKLVDCLGELKPHFDPHWHELALDQDKVALDPDYAVYLEREARGEVLCVLAREGPIVAAYFVGFIAPALHYRRCLTLIQDIFWVHPDYRATDSLGVIEQRMLCAQLFDTVKREGLRRGVQRVYYGSKAHQDASALFEEMGMLKADVYYSQWWGG